MINGGKMEFLEKLKQIDKTNNNLIATVISGKNAGKKIILSNKKPIFVSDNLYDLEDIISHIPKDKISKVVNTEQGKIYYEFIGSQSRIVICGAGHISIAIINMCKLLDLPVTVIDDRLSFTNNAIKAGADKIICEFFDKGLENIEGDKNTFFIIVTRGHRYDQICLEKIIQKENAYIGMIGSKLRVKKVISHLEKTGISKEKLDEVFTPIGLKIQAQTPEEIAVAIIAEIIQVKNQKTVQSTYSDELLKAIYDERYKDIQKALITIVSRKGSAPRGVGTKMLVMENGKMIGTIGGGCVEADIRQTALFAIKNGKSKLVEVDMTGQEAEDDGMVCGGVVEIFVDPLNDKE